MANEKLVGIAVALILLGGPALLGGMGLISARHRRGRAVPDRAPRGNGRLCIVSALLYTLAFNLTFLIQEFFLVLPKAMTPGLRPTLFHNNHSWEGVNPLAAVLQGTGAVAIFFTGIVCAALLRRGTGGSSTLRLFLIWMAYNGFMQSLPQVIVGSIEPRNDAGMAMRYLHFSTAGLTAAALVALAAIPLAASWLTRAMLTLAREPAEIADGRRRTRFVFEVATAPALLAIPLIVLFRVPRTWIEVAAVPTVVTVIGIVWMQALAWRIRDAKVDAALATGSIAYPLGAVLLLLMVFQLLLRPGIRFY